MKIPLSYKSYIIKACSFFVVAPLIFGAPIQANAGFISDLFGGSQVQADETPVTTSSDAHNSQTLPFLESSMNPDIKNTTDKSNNTVLVQNDSFISNEGAFIPDVKFEKSTVSDQIVVYTVQSGDTLSEIADTFGISMNTILWENNLSSKTISIGQKLNILPMTGVKHIVKSGDTISKIAVKYEADAEDILVFNDISKGDALKNGDIIFVPNGIIKAVISKPAPSKIADIPVVSNNTKIISGYFLRPVSGPVTSHYGPRHGSFHPGVDLGGPRGTPVMAAASGVVVAVVSGCVEGRRSCGGGYGNHIDIEHPNGTMTRYGHLSKTSISLGEDVGQGDIIGAIGSTGTSTGPHLHFEVRNASGSTMKPPF